MVRKCLAFALSAGVIFGIVASVGTSLSRADDDEKPLEKIMEKVQKHNGVIQKGVRSKPNFAKAQKDVVKRPRTSPTPTRNGTPIATISSRSAKSLKRWPESRMPRSKTPKRRSKR
jgi:hypothetical protein